MIAKFWTLFFVILWRDCLSSVCGDSLPPEIHIFTDGPITLSMTPSMTQAKPVFAAGIDYLARTYPQFKWTWDPITSPLVADCASLVDNVQFLMAHWYYRARSGNATSLPVIISAGCRNAILINALAAAWDVLLITGQDYRPDMANRQVYPTMLTTADGTPSLGVLYCALFRKMKWSKLYMLFEKTSSSEYYGGQNLIILDTMKQACDSQLTFQVTRNQFSVFDPDSVMTSILKDFNARCRIMMYFGNSPGLRKIILRAAQLNMTDDQHVYLAVRPWDSDIFGPRGSWQPTHNDHEVVHLAYQSVILVSLSDESRLEKPTMRKLIETWKNSVRPNETLITNFLPFCMSLHAALELAGIAINETFTTELRRRALAPSGRVMASRMLNRTFQLSMGDVHMMAAAQVSHHHFVRSYDRSLRGYNEFLRSSSDDLMDVYRWDWMSDGAWYGGLDFPPDEPHCGFDGHADHCRSSVNRDQSLGIAFGCLLGFCLIAIVSRRMRQTSLLNDRWWLIQLDRRVTRSRSRSTSQLYSLAYIDIQSSFVKPGGPGGQLLA